MSMDANMMVPPPAPGEGASDEEPKSGSGHSAVCAAIEIAGGDPEMKAAMDAETSGSWEVEDDGSITITCGKVVTPVPVDMIEEHIGDEPDEGDSIPPPPAA